jgi:uncharacterized metal-binding protein YceD (DUF177 family)
MRLFKKGTQCNLCTAPDFDTYDGSKMTELALPTLPLKSSTLAGRKATRFKFVPNATERAAIAQQLGLLELNNLFCKGELTPAGRHDFLLKATFQAKVVQPCSISLAPVPAEISDHIQRLFLHDYAEPASEEAEMLDETAEPLPEIIDIAAIVIEALLLALPLYPRAPNVTLTEAVFAAPDVVPLRDGALKPFAGLAGLAEMMKKPPEKPPEPGS